MRISTRTYLYAQQEEETDDLAQNLALPPVAVSGGASQLTAGSIPQSLDPASDPGSHTKPLVKDENIKSVSHKVISIIKSFFHFSLRGRRGSAAPPLRAPSAIAAGPRRLRGPAQTRPYRAGAARQARLQAGARGVPAKPPPLGRAEAWAPERSGTWRSPSTAAGPSPTCTRRCAAADCARSRSA